MIKLDEKDVKAIAINRFNGRNIKYIAGGFGIFVALLFGLLFLELRVEGFPLNLPFIPIGIILGALIFYLRKQDGFVKDFVSEWKKEEE